MSKMYVITTHSFPVLFTFLLFKANFTRSTNPLTDEISVSSVKTPQENTKTVLTSIPRSSINMVTSQNDFTRRTSALPVTKKVTGAKSENETQSLSFEELMSKHFYDCLYTHGSMSASIKRHFTFSVPNITTHNTTLTCSLTLDSPDLTVQHIRFWFHNVTGDCSRQNYVTLNDGVRNVTIRDCTVLRSVYTSLTNRVTIMTHVGQVKVLMNVKVDVEVRKPALEWGRISSGMGFIQTPGFDLGLDYPPSMDSTVKISVLPGHLTLVSLRKLQTHTPVPQSVHQCDAQADNVELYKEENSAQRLVWVTCHVDVPEPEIYSTKALWIRFVSGREAELKGFRLLYSVYNESNAPSKVPGGMWNCSVPEWPALERHFSCNLKRECEGGEDEITCPYFGSCGEDYLTLNNRCYKYVHVPDLQKESWQTASRQCEAMGGYLVSLNDHREWYSVVRVLKHRPSRRKLFVGLKGAPDAMPDLYRRSTFWADRTVAYYRNSYRFTGASCGVFYYWEAVDMIHFLGACMHKMLSTDFLCELQSTPQPQQQQQQQQHSNATEEDALFMMPAVTNRTLPVPFVQCQGGHLTHSFLACDKSCWKRQYGDDDDDKDAAVWRVPGVTSCPAPLTSLPAMFVCSSGMQRVPYSMVCDHQQQCDDGSDETFCVFADCSTLTPLLCGSSRQCVSKSAQCDGQTDCIHTSEEDVCSFGGLLVIRRLPPPALVQFLPHLSTTGGLPISITPLPTPPPPTRGGETVAVCPESHFQCEANGYCLPVFVRCNSVFDCSLRQDESNCDQFACPGFYRCHRSRICLHPTHMCDGIYQCPEKDDEFFCHLPCPSTCTCHGHAFHCPAPFPADQFPEVRFLDASGSGMKPGELGVNVMLIHLSLRRCGVEHFHNVTLPNLRILDISLNHIRVLDVKDLIGVTNLQHLDLSENPLEVLFAPPDSGSMSFPALLSLDLSNVPLNEIDVQTFSIFPEIRSLNFSQCGIVTVLGKAFPTKNLQSVDFTGCPMTRTPRTLLLGLEQLRSVQADNFKLCCPVMLPLQFDSSQCKAPQDGLSSCEALLRTNVYRVFLALFSALALIGNLGCFMLRTFCFKNAKAGFNVFVTHLSVADLLMGAYLGIIGLADRVYLGSYLWQAESWRGSVVCQFAGFLSLLSGEVSAVIICLITMDRFLVLAFPFRHLHFQHRSAHLTCVLVWLVFAALAAVPLLPVTSLWSLYSQTGICMPLPFTSSDHAGHQYTFGIIIVFNFVLFLLIATGQVFIYISVRANSMKIGDAPQKSSDVQIARRLITVVVSDFLCWFPIGLLGLLASQGHPLPQQLNVTMAIFVLPLNSALNPFLYTLNIILQHRRRRRDEKLLKDMLARISEQDVE